MEKNRALNDRELEQVNGGMIAHLEEISNIGAEIGLAVDQPQPVGLVGADLEDYAGKDKRVK